MSIYVKIKSILIMLKNMEAKMLDHTDDRKVTLLFSAEARAMYGASLVVSPDGEILTYTVEYGEDHSGYKWSDKTVVWTGNRSELFFGSSNLKSACPDRMGLIADANQRYQQVLRLL
ncbi:MAG: hypothetical protein MRY79_08405 [Alphaproteobacteria bacterium]|nr:hypothetical protein [Alphaproteobacteria bacterium]